jgi:hypothetical protein
MKKGFVTLLVLLLHACTRGGAESDYTESGDGKTLYYLDYVVEKKVELDGEYESHIMVLKKGSGEEIKRFEWGSDIEEMNRWRIVDLIKGGKKELIITQYSGGAHCCEYNWVYSCDGGLKEVLNSHDYGTLGFMAEPEDLNGDGTCELLFQNLTFSYFHRCCYAASPANRIVLEYDTEVERYVVQNAKFKSHLVSMELDSIEISPEFLELKAGDNPDYVDPGGYYLGSILNEVIPFLYVGEEEKAWELFDKTYKLKDKEAIKRLVKQKLEEDPCYIK